MHIKLLGLDLHNDLLLIEVNIILALICPLRVLV